MDEPKQLINRFVEELWNERRLEVADAIFDKDCVTHQLRSGVPVEAVPRGPQAIKEHVAGWIASFPDLRFSIEQMLSEGESTALCRARSSRTGCWWNRSACFSNLELCRAQQTWWAISYVSRAIDSRLERKFAPSARLSAIGSYLNRYSAIALPFPKRGNKNPQRQSRTLTDATLFG
ncbi:MAG: hypothetical protein DMG78_12590 [Acidobacteria bacterium]|nr:MAG: hypothetical protein DMG78_12590 [Acidobacteriota bacterium]